MTYIKTESRNHVLIITLSRPEARNAFNLAMAREMEAVIDNYENDSDLRAAIIRNEGTTFSAGQDLKAAAKGEMAVTGKRGGLGIVEKPPCKPLIAAVDGHALAGGMELTLCCDLIVASTRSVFGLAEVKRGLVALGGGCFRLPRRLPHHVAMELILTAEPMSAETMFRYGFVNRLVESHQVMEQALGLANAIASSAPLAVCASKEIACRSQSERWTDQQAWQFQAKFGDPVLRSNDLNEGLKAFAEKRDPIWRGN